MVTRWGARSGRQSEVRVACPVSPWSVAATGGIEQILALPGARQAAPLTVHHEHSTLSHHLEIALTVRRQPEPGNETLLPDEARQIIHARLKPLVQRGPVAIVAQATAAPLPGVVDLTDRGAPASKRLPHPGRVTAYLRAVQVVVVVIPRAPPRRRQSEPRLVDRLEVLDVQGVFVVIGDRCAAPEGHLVLDGIEDAFGERCVHPAQSEHHHRIAALWCNPTGNRCGPGHGPAQTGRVDPLRDRPGTVQRFLGLCLLS